MYVYIIIVFLAVQEDHINETIMNVFSFLPPNLLSAKGCCHSIASSLCMCVCVCVCVCVYMCVYVMYE